VVGFFFGSCDVLVRGLFFFVCRLFFCDFLKLPGGEASFFPKKITFLGGGKYLGLFGRLFRKTHGTPFPTGATWLWVSSKVWVDLVWGLRPFSGARTCVVVLFALISSFVEVLRVPRTGQVKGLFFFFSSALVRWAPFRQNTSGGFFFHIRNRAPPPVFSIPPGLGGEHHLLPMDTSRGRPVCALLFFASSTQATFGWFGGG